MESNLADEKASRDSTKKPLLAAPVHGTHIEIPRENETKAKHAPRLPRGNRGAAHSTRRRRFIRFSPFAGDEHSAFPQE